MSPCCAVPAIVGNAVFTGAGSGVLDNIYVDQAYVDIKSRDNSADFKIGRQFYGHQYSPVIYFGPTSFLYGLPVYSIDAGRVDYAKNSLYGTGLVARESGLALDTVQTGVITPTLPPIVDIYGLNGGYKADDLSGGAFAYERQINQSVANHDSLYLYGAKGKMKMWGIKAKALFAEDSGNKRVDLPNSGEMTPTSPTNYDARAFVAHVAATPVPLVKPWVEFAEGTEGYTPIQSDYRPGDIYGFFNGEGAQALGGTVSPGGTVSALSDRRIWGAGLKLPVSQVPGKFNVKASYWNYAVQREATATPSSFLGDEWDFDACWKYNDYVGFTAGWATFQPGGAVMANAGGPVAMGTPTSPATMAYFTTNLSFGGSKKEVAEEPTSTDTSTQQGG